MTNITTWNKKKSQKKNLLKTIEELLKKPRLEASRLQIKETCRGKLNYWRSSSPLEQRMGAFGNLNTQQEVENMGFAWAKDSWFRVENPGKKKNGFWSEI